MKGIIAEKAKESAIHDAQDTAIILLEAESKLGEILRAIPLSEKRASSAKELATLPPNISKKESYVAHTLALLLIGIITEKAKEQQETRTVF